MRRWVAGSRTVRAMVTMALKEQKVALRKQINDELKKIAPDEIERQCMASLSCHRI
jgi:hypothetical protein